MLRAGDTIPHFSVTTVEGHRVRYADLWQHRNLVLMTLPDPWSVGRNYVSSLKAHLSSLVPDDTTLVAIAGVVQNLPESALIIADRWGEVVHVTALPADVAGWPSSESVIAWVEYIRTQCPECPP